MLIWGVAELIAIAGYSIKYRKFYSQAEIKRKIRTNINTDKISIDIQDEWVGNKWRVQVIHPYLGYVNDPYRDKTQRTSEFGFVSGKSTNPIVKKIPDRIIIGIFGGSFAAQTFRHTSPLLMDRLKSLFPRVTVLNFADGGYKQPQQLLILAYMLSLGAEFDLIINIDGFNEVALPPTENIPKGVYPFYPRQWYYRASRNIIDPVFIRQIGYLEFLRVKRGQWARLFNDNKLYRSAALSFLWQYVDQEYANAIYKTRQRAEQNEKASNFVVSGPRYLYETDEKLYRDLVDMWKRGSIQMKALCDANNIEYYHFLQPNQYLHGTKPMTEKEKQIAIRDNQPYKLGVVKGYPLLRKAGKELISIGINFIDFTMIFGSNSSILYDDSCCHLNKKGYDIIMNNIYETIKEDGFFQ